MLESQDYQQDLPAGTALHEALGCGCDDKRLINVDHVHYA